MINLARRGFLFGAVATAILKPERSFFLLPRIGIVTSLSFYPRPDIGPRAVVAYQAWKLGPEVYDAAVRFASLRDAQRHAPSIMQGVVSRLRFAT